MIYVAYLKVAKRERKEGRKKDIPLELSPGSRPHVPPHLAALDRACISCKSWLVSEYILKVESIGFADPAHEFISVTLKQDREGRVRVEVFPSMVPGSNSSGLANAAGATCQPKLLLNSCRPKDGLARLRCC